MENIEKRYESSPAALEEERLLSACDLARVCRTCLTCSDDEVLLDLFTACSPDVFQYCTSLEISEADSLPRGVCSPCLQLLRRLYHFKQVAARSHALLQRTVLKTNTITKSEEKRDETNAVTILPQEDKRNSPSVRVKRLEGLADVRRRRAGRAGGRLPCPRCPRTFRKYHTLEAHVRKHFGIKPDIKCSSCDARFTSTRGLRGHVAREHPAPSAAPASTRVHQCATCGKRFAYRSVLLTHEKIHAGVKQYACHLCPTKFVQKQNLQTHLRTHGADGGEAGERYTCEQCGRKFLQAGNLKLHRLRHAGVKRHACPVAPCDMRFYVKGDLNKHMRSHSQEKPFACTVCHKTFKSSSFLVVHGRTHTGDRPFCCDVCSMRFMSRKDLRNHRMRHTGERPHACPLCPHAFIQKCALNRHLRSHASSANNNTASNTNNTNNNNNNNAPHVRA